MNKTMVWGLPVLALALTACPREPETPREELTVAAEETEGFATDTPAQVTPVPEAQTGRAVSGNLEEVHNSGVDGGVTVTAANGASEVLLRISHLQENITVYPAIHPGPCTSLGEPVALLDPLTADDTGIATGTVMADVPAEQVMDGQHSVAIHPERRIADIPPLACADLPRTP